MSKRWKTLQKEIKNKAPRSGALYLYVLKYYFSAFFSAFFVTSNMIGVAMKIEA